MVGRTGELEELISGLDSALAGRGCLFLLSGEPGIGKSRLADEFAAIAAHRGARVLWGRCWEAGGAPAYWPWVQLLRAYLRSQDPATIREQMGSGATDIAQMLPEVHDLFPDVPPPPSVDPESARFRLFDSTAKFLLDVGTVDPLTLVLDDLQAADIPSLLLLRFLTGQLLESRILILGAYRDVEVPADHPLTETISELAREAVTRHITLHGLDEEDVGRYIEKATGAVAGPMLSSTLYRQTNGNPLFLGEAVRLLAAERRLGEDADPAALRVTVPQGIRQVIARRVYHLGEAKQVLVLASVLGREFGLEPVRRLGDLSADESLELLGEAVGAGLLEEIPGAGRFRFSHDLVRETLYQELRPARRVRLHRELAQILEEMHGQDIDAHLAELAHHFFEGAPGGDVERAVDYARRAGDQAARSLAYEEAVRLYQMGLHAFELGEQPAPEAVCELLLATGEAQARAGDLPSARETFLRAAGIARRIGDGSQLARAALGYGGRFVWARAGSDPHLVPMLQDSLVLLGGDDDRFRVRLLTRLACASRDLPDRDRSDALSQQAVEIARGLDDLSTLAYALVGRAWAIYWPENPRERLEIAQKARHVAKRANDAERLFDAQLLRSLTLIEMGRIVEGIVELDTIERTADELRQSAQKWPGPALRAELALLQGSFARAEQLIETEIRPGQPPNPVRDDVSANRFHRFLLAREQDRLSEVEATVRDSVEEFPSYPLHRGALACLLLDLDRANEARGVFDELAREGFAVLHRDSAWLCGMALASEACARLGDREAAEFLYEQLLPFEGQHAVAHAEGSLGAVDRCLGLLATTLGRLDHAEQHFLNAIRINDAMGATPWTAHTQHELARMLLSRDGPGDRERAEVLGTAAGRTATELGMTSLERRTMGLLGELGVEVSEAAGTGSGDLASPIGPAVFRREGEYFSIAFEGETFRLKDTKGLRYLAHLLANPGQEVHAIDLVTLGEGGPVRAEGFRESAERAGLHSRGAGDAGDVLDPQARAAYKRRLVELNEDLDEAESFGNAERATRAREEMDVLARHLAGATGLGGQSRHSVSPAERARVSVTKAIRVALERIARHSNTLGRHLERTVRTGGFCSYSPDPRAPVAWHT
ncbi:MAG TPA: AAA family ATPase [Actinomycetota bacterium]|nr:AAA family ATPase [Actinomycetota bacterium]